MQKLYAVILYGPQKPSCCNSYAIKLPELFHQAGTNKPH